MEGYAMAFRFTSEQREEARRMEAEKARLEKIIADVQRELAPLNKKLAAFAALEEPAPEPEPTPKTNGSQPSSNMKKAIERITNERKRPMKKKVLKRINRKSKRLNSSHVA